MLRPSINIHNKSGFFWIFSWIFSGIFFSIFSSVRSTSSKNADYSDGGGEDRFARFLEDLALERKGDSRFKRSSD